MYVTGTVPSLSVTGRSAVFRGRATVTGLVLQSGFVI